MAVTAKRGKGMGRDERGSVLVSGLMLVLVMTLIGSAMFKVAVLDNRMALGDAKQAQAFYIAEAGLNAAMRTLVDGTFNTFNGSGTLITNTTFGSGSFGVTASVTSSTPKTITVTSTGCVPGVSGGNSCTTLQGAVVYQLGLAGPFFALGTFTINGLVDSFDSNVGPHSDPNSRCPDDPTAIAPEMYCGADIYANGGGTSVTATTPTVTLNSGAKVFGSVFDSKGQVAIDPDARVYGDVTYKDTCSNCASPQVQGIVSQATTPAVVPPPVGDCRPYTCLATVQSKITGNYDYSPDPCDPDPKKAKNPNAGKFTANDVVSIASTVAAPGEFCFKTFSATAANSGVAIPNTNTQRVVITVTNGVNISATDPDKGIINNTGKADQFQILSSATNQNDNVQITGGNSAYVYVYAPKTQIKVSGSGKLYGALLGNDLTATGGAQLHFDKALGNSGNLAGGVPTYTWVSGSWKACKNPSCT
jgi:hypothetical protein